jgi:hypothetical protein
MATETQDMPATTPLTALEAFLIESFPDLVSSPDCATMSAEEIAIGLLGRLVPRLDPEREEAPEAVEVSMEGMIALLGSAVRLHWKGYAPEIDTELCDQEGRLWKSSIDHANRAVRLYMTRGQFVRGGEVDTEVHVFPIERLKKFRI